MGKDLAVSVVIDTLLGPLELEDLASGYELHKETIGLRATSYRKVEVSGDFTEGTDTQRAVRANVTEQLSVWVAGTTQFEFQTRVRALTDALEQLSYTITRTVGDAIEVWQCTTADYSLETSQEFLVATIGLIKATVPRKPAVALSQVII